MKNYGKQIATIAYGGGINIRAAVAEFTSQGHIAIWDSRCVRIHEMAK